MRMIIKLGFRNLLRNKKRSLLSSTAIGLGLASLICYDALMIGMMGNIITNVTQTFSAHIQIHHPNFQESRDSKLVINNSDKIIKKVQKDNSVFNYTTRVQALSMISSARNSKNLFFVGIDPVREKELSLFDESIIEGSYLKSENGILIGKKLQKHLGVKVSGKVVLTVTNSQTEEISQEMFRVEGIYHLGSKFTDENMVLINQRRAQKMLGIGEGIHEIAITLKNIDLLEDEDFKLIEQLNTQGVIAQSWKDLNPSIKSMLEMNLKGSAILYIILLTLVGLGIINTLFMSIYERFFELGVIQAIGTRRWQMILMVLAEAATLAILSIVVGIFISLVIITLVNINGIDYSGIEIAQMTFREPIYFVLRWQQFTIIPAILWLFTVVISFYPGHYASKMTLAEAVKKTL